MKTCPACQSSYPTGFSVCPRDGTSLHEVTEWHDGAVIRGKYRVMGKVGQGGMATVYRALHTHFHEVRALKVINDELAKDPVFVRRFTHEAVVTRKLQHPNAVRVDDIDEAEDGRPFIVMELIEGRSLKEVIRREAPLDPIRACSIVKQVASALEAAHRLGIVHRDIKPANIVLIETPSGEQAKVLDFGIAKLKEGLHEDTKAHLELTAAGMVVGSPAYMSPEQAMGKVGQELDGRSDLYSLGIVMFQMLTGSLPLKAESDVGFALAHIQTSPTAIHEHRPDIPAPIADVVMKCLEKDTKERPSCAREFIEDLDRAETSSGLQMQRSDLQSSKNLILAVLNAGAPSDSSSLPRPAAAAVRQVEESDPDWLMTQVGNTRFLRRNREFIAGGMSTQGMLRALMAMNGARQEPPKTGPVAPAANVEPDAIAPTMTTGSRSMATVSQMSRGTQSMPAPSVPVPAVPALADPAPPVLSTAPAVPAPVVPAVAAAPAQGEKSSGRPWMRRVLICVPFLVLAGAWGVYHFLRDPRPHFEKAKTLMARHDLVGAIAEYRTAVELKPDFTAAHAALAAALDAQGDRDGSIAEYRQVTRLDPTSANAFGQIGYLLALKGQNDAAIAGYKSAIALRPQWAEAHYDLGKSLAKTGQADAAIAEYQKAVGLKPDYAEAHHSLGFAYVSQGQYDEAIAELQKAVALRGNDADAHQNLGFSYLKKNQYDDATVELQKALAIKPNDASTRLLAGFAYAKNGQLDEAIAEYQEALRLKPDLAMAQANLKAAQKARNSASGKKAKKVWDAIHLGDSFRDHGQYDQAIGQYEKALHIDASSLAAKNRLQRVRELKASAGTK